MLRVAAVFSHAETLGDTPPDLRAALQRAGLPLPRRVNRYIELALLGAVHCARAAGRVGSDAALYLACEAPMLADCVRALRGVIVEQRPPTPFEFMNISGNMAGFYIAQQLGISGPQLALHRRHASLEAALELLALSSAQHRRALLGYVEEGVWPLGEQRRRLELPADRALAECSHWLYLDADCAQPLALVDSAPRCDRIEDLAALARGLPKGWRVVLGAGCDDGEVSALRVRGIACELAELSSAYSTGDTAARLIAYIERPDAPGLLHVSRAGDGGYYATRVTTGS